MIIYVHLLDFRPTVGALIKSGGNAIDRAIRVALFPIEVSLELSFARPTLVSIYDHGFDSGIEQRRAKPYLHSEDQIKWTSAYFEWIVNRKAIVRVLLSGSQSRTSGWYPIIAFQGLPFAVAPHLCEVKPSEGPLLQHVNKLNFAHAPVSILVRLVWNIRLEQEEEWTKKNPIRLRWTRFKDG